MSDGCDTGLDLFGKMDKQNVGTLHPSNGQFSFFGVSLDFVPLHLATGRPAAVLAIFLLLLMSMPGPVHLWWRSYFIL